MIGEHLYVRLFNRVEPIKKPCDGIPGFLVAQAALSSPLVNGNVKGTVLVTASEFERGPFRRRRVPTFRYEHGKHARTL